MRVYVCRRLLHLRAAEASHSTERLHDSSGAQSDDGVPRRTPWYVLRVLPQKKQDGVETSYSRRVEGLLGCHPINLEKDRSVPHDPARATPAERLRGRFAGHFSFALHSSTEKVQKGQRDIRGDGTHLEKKRKIFSLGTVDVDL
jgi:hypothetical protein